MSARTRDGAGRERGGASGGGRARRAPLEVRGGEALEREADRAADAVLAGSALPARGLSLSRIRGAAVQREEAGRKREEEKYLEAGKRAAEAFLETEAGRKVKELVERDPLVQAGERLVSSVAGKVVVGAAATAAVAALAARHAPLPFGIPEIPLDRLQPGLKAKVTWEGPVDRPTKAMITFTFTPPGETRKPARTRSEELREETARMQAELARFRAGLRHAPGSAEARRQEAEDEAAWRVAAGRSGGSPGLATRAVPGLDLRPASEVAPAEDLERRKEEGGEAVQRKAAPDEDGAAAAPAGLDDVLGSAGEPLDAATLGLMEARLGHDFRRVRIHADGRAARSARDAGAHAYTIGDDVVFAAGRYSPHTPQGRHLLAHELAHVVQQRGAPAAARHVQRRTAGESLAIWLGLAEGDFGDAELLAYVKSIAASGAPEDAYDSDNKARAVVRRWKSGARAFALDANVKVLLVKEMQSGFTGDDDEQAILDLLDGSDDADLRAMFAPGKLSVEDLNDDFHGEEWDRLRAFYEARFEGGMEALLRGRVEPKARKARPPARAAAGAERPGPAAAEPGAKPRRTFVFLMGEDRRGDRNRFFEGAENYYRARIPGATFVRNRRTLVGVLETIGALEEPAGEIYLVTHAAEDGSLQFGLRTAGPRERVSVQDLREALHPAAGPSLLPKVGKGVDARTRIHVKVCDLGRTPEIVELVDEAFGGLGRVTAPTHEQLYDWDRTLAARARRAARPEVEAAHPTPPEIARGLEGKARAAAVAERRRLLAERGREVQREVEERVERAATYEAFTGPMFQRPGVQRYTAGELRPEIARLYGHLSQRQQLALARRLVAPDPRGEEVARKDGLVGQRGQRVYSHVRWTQEFLEPRTVAEANAHLSRGYPEHFRPRSVTVEREDSAAGTRHTVRVDGTIREPRSPPVDESVRIPLKDKDRRWIVVPPDAELVRRGRAALSNPHRYAWRVDERHARTGWTTRRVLAERVVAYLHHGSLDVSPTEHFTRPLEDPRFFATSTFTPPPPAGKQP
jgi:hypothetical protein